MAIQYTGTEFCDRRADRLHSLPCSPLNLHKSFTQTFVPLVVMAQGRAHAVTQQTNCLRTWHRRERTDRRTQLPHERVHFM